MTKHLYLIVDKDEIDAAAGFTGEAEARPSAQWAMVGRFRTEKSIVQPAPLLRQLAVGGIGGHAVEISRKHYGAISGDSGNLIQDKAGAILSRRYTYVVKVGVEMEKIRPSAFIPEMGPTDDAGQGCVPAFDTNLRGGFR